MSHLRLTCFQSAQVWLNDQPLTRFPRVKALALLIYLAIEQERPHQRNTLAGLLWPDSPEARARRNLSQTLMDLRRTLGDAGVDVPNDPPIILTAPQTIVLNPQIKTKIDAVDFTAAVANGNHAQAVELYSGPFLADFETLDSDIFESWVETQRENLHRRALDAFRKLGQIHEEEGEFEQARQVVNRLLTLAPWQEEAHAQLMRLLALCGERSAALAQYDTLSEMLMDELGVSPSDETNALYDQILAGDLKASSTSQQPLTTSQQPPLTPFQVTAPPPHFVGRSGETAQIQESLAQSGSTVVALVGMGGLGKTTLAAQIAHAMRNDFADGVLWGNPAISSVMDILDNWGKAYGYDFSGLSDIESRGAAVRGVLAEKSALLVLDNVTNASQVKPVLTGSEGGAILITTRDWDVAHALNAHVVPLGELSAKSGRELLSKILGEERVAAEDEAADKICQLLHYLPLAVEIAAQRLKSRARLPLSQMAQRLSDTGQRLGLKISDQAVRTSFEVSWEALDKELRDFFPLLAVFEGRPFTAAALTYIAEMDQFDVEDLLYGLNALSLIKEDETAYFRQHPLLADFAKEKLDSSTYHQQHGTITALADEKLRNAEDTYERLVDYYLAFVEENQKNFDVLEPEWPNIGFAIEKAHQMQLWAQVLSFTDSLSQTWSTSGRYGESRLAYELAHEATAHLENEEAEANILLRWGEACLEQNDYEEANQHLQRSLAFFQKSNNASDRAASIEHLARIAIETNAYDEAKKFLEEALAIRSALDERAGIASIYYQKAWLDYAQAKWAHAQESAETALDMQTGSGDSLGHIRTARLLSQIYWVNGDYTKALHYCQQAQTLSEDSQNMNELAITLYTLTAILQKMGEFDKAQLIGTRSLALLRKMGQTRIEGMLLSQLGEIQHSLGNPGEALALTLKSVHIARSVKDKVSLSYTLLRLETLYREQGCLDRSKEILAEVESIALDLDHALLKKYVRERSAAND